MLRVTIFLLLFCSLVKLGAQDTLSSFTYFNKTYGNDTSSWTSLVGLETDRGILTIGSWIGVDSTALHIRLLDDSGVIENILPFDVRENLGICYGGANTSQVNDSTFVFINCYRKWANNSQELDIYFVKANSKGEVLNSTDITSSVASELPRALIPLSNGDYLIVGSYQPAGEDARFYVAKIDNNGNKIWENTEIAGDPGGNTVAFSAVELDNGNFLVGGYANVDGQDNDWLIASIGADGNLLSTNFYGTEERECAMSLIPRGGDEIQIISCGFVAGTLKMQTASLDASDMTIEELKSFQAFEDANSPWTPPFVLGNGNVVFVSRYKNEDGWDQPVIIEITAEGDFYSATPLVSPNPNKHVYVHDMRPTKDGGYLITGYEHFPSPQRSWVLKVDSLFNTCSELGCDSTVYVIDSLGSGIEEAAWKETSSFVFPNPAQDQINLQEPFVHLLQEIRLFDLEGRLLKKERIPQMDLLGLPSGLYIVEIELQDLGIHRQKLFITD